MAVEIASFKLGGFICGLASINRNPCWNNTRTAGMTNTAAVALSQYTFILAQQVDIHDGKYTRADRTIGLAGKALMCILEGLLRTVKEAKSTQPSTSLLLIPSPIDDNDIASSNHSLWESARVLEVQADESLFCQIGLL